MLSTSDYRHLARASLKRSIELQEAGEDHSLVYAALELRKAMEALTYERARAFKDDFPPSEYATWRPKDVMSVLLEIDGNADKNSSLSIGEEEEYGKGSNKMEPLGTETVLNMATIKKNYAAIGSYLHIPTIEHLSEGKGPDFKKLRKRCENLSDYLAKVLDSPVWGLVFRNHAQFKCECGVTIRRHLPHGSPPKIIHCFDCVASYTLTDLGNGKVNTEPLQSEIKCSCGQSTFLWRRDVTPGTSWPCDACSKTIRIGLGITVSDSPAPTPAQ